MIGQVHLLVYYVYEDEIVSVCLSVRPSAVTQLAQSSQPAHL